MSTLQVNSILDSSGGNSAIINGTYIRPGALDPDNRVINGAFDFWQRGTSGSTSNLYVADRWINDFLGGTVTMSRQAFTIGFTLGSNTPEFALRQTISGQTLSSHYSLIQQRIEDVRSYAGQTITVLGWANRSSGAGNMVVGVEQYFGSGGSPSESISAGAVTVPLTGTFQPFAATFTVPPITDKTLGTNGDDFLRLMFWTSAGSNFNARTNSLGLQTIGVQLWGIHIKVGTHTIAACDLYRKPELGLELMRCQRYYEAGNYYDVLGISNASVVASVYTHVVFSVTKRRTPAVSGTNEQGTAAVTAATVHGVAIGRSDAIANRVNSGTYTADAEL